MTINEAITEISGQGLSVLDLGSLGAAARAAADADMQRRYDDNWALMTFSELDDEFGVADGEDFGLLNDDDEFDFGPDDADADAGAWT